MAKRERGKREQISVPVTHELHETIARIAASDGRTKANWIKHLIAAAVRESGNQQAA